MSNDPMQFPMDDGKWFVLSKLSVRIKDETALGYVVFHKRL